jgi:succinyl-CoA synthetase alpha subunit
LPDKPAVAFIGGRSAPEGKRLGHAGAIISGKTGTPQSKVDAFHAAGVPVAERPSQIPGLLEERLAARR